MEPINLVPALLEEALREDIRVQQETESLRWFEQIEAQHRHED